MGRLGADCSMLLAAAGAMERIRPWSDTLRRAGGQVVGTTFAWAEPGSLDYAEATATYNTDVHLVLLLAATVGNVEEARRAVADARSRGLGVRVLSPPGTSPTRARRWVTRRSSRCSSTTRRWSTSTAAG